MQIFDRPLSDNSKEAEAGNDPLNVLEKRDIQKEANDVEMEQKDHVSEGTELDLPGNEDASQKSEADSTDKLQSELIKLNELCISHLKAEETEQALEALKQAEIILEEHTNEGKDVDRNMIIVVLYNQACCY